MPLRETRRILLDGNIVDVERHGDELVAGDGRTVGIAEAVHLAPVVPSKIICVHLNYSSRVRGDDGDPAAGTDVLSQARVGAQCARVSGRETSRAASG